MRCDEDGAAGVPARPAEWRPAQAGGSPWPWHLHRYRWAGEDAFSGASVYACRCGVARPGP